MSNENDQEHTTFYDHADQKFERAISKIKKAEADAPEAEVVNDEQDKSDADEIDFDNDDDFVT